MMPFAWKPYRHAECACIHESQCTHGPGCKTPIPEADPMRPIERARLFLRDTEQDPGYETVAFDPGEEIAIEAGSWGEFVPISELEGAVALLDALDRYTGHSDGCDAASGAPDCTCGFDELYTRVRGVVRGESDVTPREVTARADVARVEHLQQQMGDEG